MTLHAVVIAGGAGERIRSVARATPKALLEIGGAPLLEHQIALLRRYGIRDIHVTVRARDLAAFRAVGCSRRRKGCSRRRKGCSRRRKEAEVLQQPPIGLLTSAATSPSSAAATVDLLFHPEPRPMGTAGSIKPLLDQLGDNFLVLYGDVMVHMDVEALIRFHRENRAAATLVVHPTDHPLDSDLVELDQSDRIRAFHFKPHASGHDFRNLGNAAVYVLSAAICEHIPDGASDFMRDVFPDALAAGLPLFGYRTREYLKDIGTPARLAAVRSDFDAGRIERRHRSHALPAIFFDRDGTLCRHVPLLHKVDDMHLLPHAAEAVRRVNQSDWLAVVVTNQPVIAQGLCTQEELNRIHGRFEMMLGEGGAKLDGIFLCPHYPRSGYPGEVAALKIACECRKPGGALVKQAARELNIDLARSVFIGDTTRDVETGKRLGLRTVLVQTGQAGRDAKFAAAPDCVCANVAEAVDRILQGDLS